MEEKLLQKQLKINKISQKLDHLRGAYKSAWFDLGRLKIEKEELEVLEFLIKSDFFKLIRILINNSTLLLKNTTI